MALDLVTAVDLNSLKDFVVDLSDKFGEFEVRAKAISVDKEYISATVCLGKHKRWPDDTNTLENVDWTG